MRIGAAWSFLIAAAATNLVACSPEPPEGRLKCRMASECPDGWFCRDNGHAEKRCYKTAGATHDAGARSDAGRTPHDAGLASDDAEVTSTGGMGGQGGKGGSGGSSGSGGSGTSGGGGTHANGGSGASGSGGDASGTGGSGGSGGGTSGSGGTAPEAPKWDSSDALWDTAVWN